MKRRRSGPGQGTSPGMSKGGSAGVPHSKWKPIGWKTRGSLPGEPAARTAKARKNACELGSSSRPNCSTTKRTSMIVEGTNPTTLWSFVRSSAFQPGDRIIRA